jgi:PIN domain nuclease of toxin-antitoxin system
MSAYLLDTHSFLWSVFSPEKLSPSIRTALADPQNTVFVSSVTFWEIALKAGIGKLTLNNCTPDELPKVAEQLGYLPLPLEPTEAATFHRLPRNTHKDPFDRMLIWQAIHQKLCLVSKDGAFAEYLAWGLEVLW